MSNPNDQTIFEQILQAYHDDQINWSQVPAIKQLIQQEVQYQVNLQVSQLAQDTTSQYQQQLDQWTSQQAKKLRDNQRLLADLQTKINYSKEELETSKHHQWLALLAQIIGVIILVLTVLLLLWLIVPMVLHGSGIATIWHTLSPNWSLWGALRTIGALLLIFGLILLEITVIAVPVHCLTVIFDWIARIQKQHKLNQNRY